MRVECAKNVLEAEIAAKKAAKFQLPAYYDNGYCVIIGCRYHFEGIIDKICIEKGYNYWGSAKDYQVCYFKDINFADMPDGIGDFGKFRFIDSKQLAKHSLKNGDKIRFSAIYTYENNQMRDYDLKYMRLISINSLLVQKKRL